MCILFGLSSRTIDMICTKNFCSSENSWLISNKTCMTSCQTDMNPIRPATNSVFSFKTSFCSFLNRVSGAGSTNHGRAYTFAALVRRRAFFFGLTGAVLDLQGQHQELCSLRWGDEQVPSMARRARACPIRSGNECHPQRSEGSAARGHRTGAALVSEADFEIPRVARDD